MGFLPIDDLLRLYHHRLPAGYRRFATIENKRITAQVGHKYLAAPTFYYICRWLPFRYKLYFILKFLPLLQLLSFIYFLLYKANRYFFNADWK